MTAPNDSPRRITRADVLYAVGKEKRDGKHRCPKCDDYYLSVFGTAANAGFSCKRKVPCSPTDIAAYIYKKLDERASKPPKEDKKPSGDGMTLADYADWKKLPVDWLRKWFYAYDAPHPYYALKSSVALPYYKPPTVAPPPNATEDEKRGELTGTKWRWGRGKDERAWQYKPDRTSPAYLYGGRFLAMMMKATPADRGTLKYLFITEGESNTQALCRAGYPAIGVSGAEYWKAEYAELECFRLSDTLYVLQDPDAAGAKFAEKVAASFEDKPVKVRVVRLPNDEDVSELWIRSESDAFRMAGSETLFDHDLQQAVLEADAAPIAPTIATVEDPTPHLVPFPADVGADVFDACPILRDFVDRVLPHVEADANILTADFLACAGAIVGGRVFALFGWDKHAPPTFHLTIAGTGIGKGTALNAAEAVFRPADPRWYDILRRSARSGQALVRMLKEVSEQMIEYKDKDGETAFAENPKYTGGRMLLCFSEMASLFGSMKIKESVLSPYFRDAYDGKPLANEKGALAESVAVTEPYTLAVLGSITPWELGQCIGAADFANGLANRFVWWASQPSKRLPRSPRPPDLSDLSARIRALVPANPNPVQLDYSADGGREWDTWAAGLPDDDGTPLDSACARTRANALRLAVLFAVLDESRLTLQGTPLEIRAHHVRAAAAIMERHRASVEWYLSQTPATPATGDGERKIARVRNLAAANDGRFTGAQLYRLFSHGTKAERESISVAAGFKKEPGATEKGHAIEVWVPARENGQEGGQHA